jgi:Zn-dependent M16 (insulinase) family peptidase
MIMNTVGLIKLLPVFLDHVVHPTLTDESFTTEIYHVDGEGKQNGVVFCEMQVRVRVLIHIPDVKNGLIF